MSREQQTTASTSAEHRDAEDISGVTRFPGLLRTCWKLMDIQWANIIAPLLQGLEYSTVIDTGEWPWPQCTAARPKAGLVYCIDIDPENIKFLKQRYGGDKNDFVMLRNDGATLPFFKESRHRLVVLLRCARPLRSRDCTILLKRRLSGTADGRSRFHTLFHYYGKPRGHFSNNPHWRNFMSFELFSHLAIKAGFAIRCGQKIDWGNVPDLDCVFLLRKE